MKKMQQTISESQLELFYPKETDSAVETPSNQEENTNKLILEILNSELNRTNTPELNLNQTTTQLPTYSEFQSNFLSLLCRTKQEESSIIAMIAEENHNYVYAQSALFFKGEVIIQIPRKVKAAVKKYLSKPLLREIHPNLETAIELCLLFLSNLTDTYFREQGLIYIPEGEWRDEGYLPELEGWKPLLSTRLRAQLYYKDDTYKLIREALIIGTKKGPIIECDFFPIIGHKPYFYRLGENYRCKGIETHKIKSKLVCGLIQDSYAAKLYECNSNPIARNLLALQKRITLPTKEEIEEEAIRLIGIDYETKKGKKLTFLNKHSKTYFKDNHKRSFVEESLEIFEYLTANGLMIPQVGGDRSGGRVVDSFTLMPSWIRNLCKIDGNRIVEVDYSCLHPNIAVSLSEGSQQFITHKKVADELRFSELTEIGELLSWMEDENISTKAMQSQKEENVRMLKLTKIEHLSFFNKEWNQMMQSPLFDFYSRIEPTMMANIYLDKTESEFGHKITSRKLFNKEVEIMREVIVRLNSEGIYAGYVYDALFCTEDEKETVMRVMNEVVLEHGVWTTAK